MSEFSDNRSIIHILNQDGDFQGCGYLFNGRYAITCGSVIKSCLGCTPETEGIAADQEITVSFPFGDSEQRTCRVLQCNCASRKVCQCDIPGSRIADLALIEFYKPFHFRSSSRLIEELVREDVQARLLDFTNDREPGKPLRGVIKPADITGLQLLSLVDGLQEGVRPGYSGAPVFAESGACMGLQVDPPAAPDEEAEPTPHADGCHVLPAALIQAELESYDLDGRYPIRRNPYKGVQFFKAQDQADFFGRETETGKLCSCIEAAPVVPVIGPAGCGKSSLIRAGVIPHFESANWAVAMVTPGPDLDERLTDAILRARDGKLDNPDALDSAEESETTDRSDLLQCFKSIDPTAAPKPVLAEHLAGLFGSDYFTNGAAPQLLLVIDQFEDIFGPAVPDETRQRLISLLCGMPEDESWQQQVRIVCVLRSESYNQYMEHGNLARRFEADEFKLYRLSREQLLAAAVEPARRMGVTFAPGVAERILDDLAAAPGSLDMLQVVLRQLWSRQRKYRFTLDTYLNLIRPDGITGLFERCGVKSAAAPEAGRPDPSRRVARRASTPLVQPEPASTDGEAAFSRKIIAGSIFDPRENGQDSSPGEQPKEQAETASEPQIAVAVEDPEPAAPIPEDILQPGEECSELDLDEDEQSGDEVDADGETVEVINWSAEAVTQAIHHSHAIAAKAEQALSHPEIDHQVPLLLAVEAARVDSNLYTNSVLRESLKLLPRSVHCFKQRGTVWSTVFSPDGRLVATAGADRSARIREVESGEEILCINHKDIVRNVFFSSDGRRVATNSSDGVVNVTDIATGRRLRSIDEHSKIHAMAFSPDGEAVVISSYTMAKVYRVSDGKVLLESRHGDKIYSVAFSPDSYFVATGSHDGKIKVYSIRTGTEISSVTHDDWVISVTFNHDSTMIATASGDRTARVWRVSTGDEICRVKHDDWVRSVVFNHDSRFIATASGDHTASVWFINIGKEVCRIIHDDWVRAVAFNSDGSLISTASRDGTARVSEVKTGRTRLSVKHNGSVHSAVFNHDDSLLATASSDGTARICPLVTSEGLCCVQHKGPVTAAAFSPDDHQLATAGHDWTARICRIATNEQLLQTTAGDELAALAYSHDGRLLAMGGRDKSVIIQRTDTGEISQLLKLGAPVTCIAFSTDDRLVAAGGSNGTAVVFETTTGKRICQLKHDGPVSAVDFNANGQQLAIASENGTAGIYRINTGKSLLRITHEGGVHAAVFNTRGNLIATAGADGTARVFQVSAGRQVCRVSHDGPVHTVCFSPNGKRIVTAGADNSARLWHVDSGKQLYAVTHDGAVNSAAFNHDGDLFVTASADGTARVILANSGEELCCINHDAPVTTAGFNTAGTLVATACSDGKAKVSYRYTSDLLREARRRLARNFSHDEWKRYFGHENYRRTVPWLPEGE